VSSPPAGEPEGPIPQSPWYRRWFGEVYLELYPHRDSAEAAQAVDLLMSETRLHSRDFILDLACGAGRHLFHMEERGLRPVGLDLSYPLLLRARALGPSTTLVRADMRELPFRNEWFGAVASFFTSFGYFPSDRGDRSVLLEVRRVLRIGGCLLLDFLNAEQVRRTMSPRDEREIGARRVVQERRLVNDGRSVEKTIRIEGAGRDVEEVFHERVRLYSPEELGTLLAGCGLAPERWFGDYGGGPLTPTAPRAIVLARAS
jgi:SAM-dependent methyltransferase